MHTYDDNCDITWENVADNFDHYYAVHLGNWFLSAFFIRDFYILHFWHMFDEIIEISWQHILPHFRECWWDHIFCDILLSNIPAVTLGLYMVKKMGMQPYNFYGEGYENKPFLEWECWKCHKKFAIIAYINILLTIHFLMGFLTINMLLIPPVHAFPILRLLMFFGLGSIAFRESYEDSRTWNTPERKYAPVEGRYRWLVVGILFTEIGLCYKYRKNTGNIIEDAVTPWYIWVPWTGSLLAIALYWMYLRFKEGATVKWIDEDEAETRKKYNKGFSKTKKVKEN